MEDESYFSIDGSCSYGNDYYFEHIGLDTPDSVMYKSVSKFAKQVLVWLAMSDKSRSEPVIMDSGLAINSERYVHL
jgi:hypothetical protein